MAVGVVSRVNLMSSGIVGIKIPVTVRCSNLKLEDYLKRLSLVVRGHHSKLLLQ